jgi:secreted trypsin-like serine protease
LDDAQRINPAECGQLYVPTSSAAGDRNVERRFLSGKRANQREWNWQVCLLTDEMKATSGTLINSQWVLTRAKFIEYMTFILSFIF